MENGHTAGEDTALISTQSGPTGPLWEGGWNKVHSASLELGPKAVFFSHFPGSSFMTIMEPE